MGLVKRCKALLLLILILSQVVLATGKEVHYLTLVDINTNKTKTVVLDIPIKNASASITDILYTKDGYILTGSIFEEDMPSTYGFVAKFNFKGKITWYKELGKKAKDSAFYRILKIDNRRFLLLGSVNGSYSPGETASGWVVVMDDNGKVLKDFDIKVAKVVRLTDGYILDKNKALIVGKIRRGNRYDINPNDGGFWGIIDLNSYNMEKSKIIDSGFWFDSINPTGKRSFLVWSENNIGEIILEGSFKWKLDLSSEMCPKIVSIQVKHDGYELLCKNLKLINIDQNGRIRHVKGIKADRTCILKFGVALDDGNLATLCENEKTKSLYVLKIYTDFAEGRALLNIGKRSNEVIYIRQGF